MVRKKGFANHEFLARIREHLSMEAVVQEINAEGRPEQSAFVGDLEENTFYVFDAEAMAAVCHAIEDVALEEANGSILGAFQEFKQFEPHRECYGHLAATIDRVEVLGWGKTPRPLARVTVLNDLKRACKDFVMALYQGRRVQALAIGRQIDPKGRPEQRQFVGFYTFNPGLIERVRRDIEDVMGGRCAGLREFTRQQAIDQASKQIQQEFLQQRDAMNDAMRRLQMDGKRYRAGDLASDLEKSLSRLQTWKERLPRMLSRTDLR